MLCPALFIGLGSTGMEILVRLEHLVEEEYGTPSLPIFKYVAFETDEEREAPEDSQIRVVHPTIKYTGAIKHEIETGNREYYKDWLDESVLEIPMFTEGAGNIRMAGRLCLWENWINLAGSHISPGCAPVLQGERNAITAGANINAAQLYLATVYEKWGKVVPSCGIPIDPLPNIYIVGTLCGGTCSGMFIDVTYYMKHISGLWRQNLGAAVPKVMGFFTVLDEVDLLRQELEVQFHAANCWAALLEYDFYCHGSTKYQVTFPDGTQLDTGERPFDYMYVLSCSSDKQRMADAGGEADQKSLANMVAMALFSETVEGLLDRREQIRVTALNWPRAVIPNEAQHMASLATCGVATVRYPKFRVVEGTSCRYAGTLCKEWIGDIPDAHKAWEIRKDAQRDWETIKRDAGDKLMLTDGGLPAEMVENWFNANRSTLANKSAKELVGLLTQELERIAGGGSYDVLKGALAGACLQAAEDEVVKRIGENVQARLNEEMNIADAMEYLRQVDDLILESIEAAETSGYPKPYMARAWTEFKTDFWVRAVGKAREVLREKKACYIDEMEELIISQIEKVKDYRLATGALRGARRRLGVGVTADEEALRAGIRTINQELDQLVLLLNKCGDYFSDRAYEMASEREQTQDTLLVYRNGDLNQDVDELEAKLKVFTDRKALGDKMRTRLIGGIDALAGFSEWLEYGVPARGREAAIRDCILDAVREEALGLIQDFPIAKHLLNRPHYLASLCNVAKGSFPALQLTGPLAAPPVHFGPGFICSRDDDVYASHLEDLRAFLASTCTPGIGFPFEAVTHMEELGHLLILYREEMQLYIDENLLTAPLFEREYREHEDSLRGAEEAYSRTVHTHRQGRRYFDVLVSTRRAEAENLMRIALEVFSTRGEKGEHVDSEMFVIMSGRPYLEFKRPDGLKFVITGDAAGVEFLAQWEDAFEYFKDVLKGKAEAVGKDGMAERVNRHAQWVKNYRLSLGDSTMDTAAKAHLDAEGLMSLLTGIFPELFD